MNQVKIESLKSAAKKAQAAYTTEQSRLIEAGYKSQQRYAMLKDLKSAADAAHAEYSKFAKGQIHNELTKIIEAGKPARQAAARERSAWKMAKYNAGLTK